MGRQAEVATGRGRLMGSETRNRARESEHLGRAEDGKPEIHRASTGGRARELLGARKSKRLDGTS